MSSKQPLRTRAVMVVVALAVTQIVSAQATDRRRMEREIEIMNGILETTLRFAIDESSEPPDSQHIQVRTDVRLLYSGGLSKAVRGYYLQDQGVVFVVRAGRAPQAVGDYGSFKVTLKSLRFINRAEGEDAQKILEERQAEAKARIERLQARTDSVKQHLVEALANHGDSMTVLAQDQYINLIIEPDSSPGYVGGAVFVSSDSRQVRTETLTVRKSWISAYKAGRLTMAELKDKVLEY